VTERIMDCPKGHISHRATSSLGRRAKKECSKISLFVTQPLENRLDRVNASNSSNRDKKVDTHAVWMGEVTKGELP